MKQKLLINRPTDPIHPVGGRAATVQKINNGSIAKKVLDDTHLTERQPWGSRLCRDERRGGFFSSSSHGTSSMGFRQGKPIHFEPHVFTCQRALSLRESAELIVQLSRQVYPPNAGEYVPDFPGPDSFEFGKHKHIGPIQSMPMSILPDYAFLSSGSVCHRFSPATSNFKRKPNELQR
jgi:hypothetical protein